MKRHIVAVCGLTCLLCLGSSRVEGELNVVATLTTFADLTTTIGGGHINVSSVASPRFNPHFIEPKPSDVLRVKKADLFIHAGLDLEAWRGALVDAAGNPQVRPGGDRELALSTGVPLLEVPDRTITRSEGDIHLFGNPHYWLSPENGRIMARLIAGKLSAVDPANAADYAKNLAAFEARLDEKIPQWKAAVAAYAGTELVGYHKEWPYLMEFLGLKMDKYLEPKPGIPPTPKQTEYLTQYMTENHVKVIVQTSYFPPKAADTLAERSGATVVMLSQSVGDTKEATDYVQMLEYNVNALATALKG